MDDSGNTRIETCKVLSDGENSIIARKVKCIAYYAKHGLNCHVTMHTRRIFI